MSHTQEQIEQAIDILRGIILAGKSAPLNPTAPEKAIFPEPPPLEKEECRSCRFLLPAENAHATDRCRRHAPRLQAGIAQYQYPPVFANAWCGEYRRKP